MGLSDLKVAVKRDCRIQYRHLFDTKPQVALASAPTAPSTSSSGKAKKRVWKWGSDSSAEFERWSKAFRTSLDQLAEVGTMPAFSSIVVLTVWLVIFYCGFRKCVGVRRIRWHCLR
jgi:hypothetical protein